MGKLDAKKTNVGTGVVGAPACGDVMKFQIEVDEDGKIVEAKFKTFGCGSAIASSSLATEWVKGKSIDQAASIKNSDIAKELSLPPVKLHCSSKLSTTTLTLLVGFRKCCFQFFLVIKRKRNYEDFVVRQYSRIPLILLFQNYVQRCVNRSVMTNTKKIPPFVLDSLVFMQFLFQVHDRFMRPCFSEHHKSAFHCVCTFYN